MLTKNPSNHRPGCLNSATGLITTFINVYTAQSGYYSITAKVTLIVTGSCMVVTAVLFALYNFLILRRVKKGHQRQMELEKSNGSSTEEGIMHKIERKAKEPALEPGSVV
jgi:hypothetical protein